MRNSPSFAILSAMVFETVVRPSAVWCSLHKGAGVFFTISGEISRAGNVTRTGGWWGALCPWREQRRPGILPSHVHDYFFVIILVLLFHLGRILAAKFVRCPKCGKRRRRLSNQPSIGEDSSAAVVGTLLLTKPATNRRRCRPAEPSGRRAAGDVLLHLFNMRA